MNIFRTDGWVKSSLGPAIPGAQIFVCTQPANIAAVPPSPLAAIFSDPNGLVPIQQPIISDGFGHYDFYTTPGVYTVVIGLGGIVQEVLPDQSVGGFGSGGSLLLQANGVAVADQLLLNFVGAGSVSVADAGSGTIIITGAAATPTVLQTNGVPNTLQSILNLIQGTGMSLVPNGSGGVTINSTVSGVAVVPYMMGAGEITPPQGALTTVYPSGDTANEVIVTRFGWAYSLTFHTISFSDVSGQSGIHFAVGIYSGPTSAIPGTLLWSSGDIPVPNTGAAATQTASVPAYTLLPGDYYLATTTSASFGGFEVYGINLNLTPGSGVTFFNGPPVGCGKATNVSTNGPLTLPATLGTVSPNAGGNSYGYPMMYFY